MRILWVENHAVFVQVAGRQFLSTHDLTVVSSISDARDALRINEFDLLLVDFDLDDGKGVEVVELAKLLVAPPPIIAVSSHAEGNTALVASGANGVCPKTKFSSIAEIIQSVLKEQQKT